MRNFESLLTSSSGVLRRLKWPAVYVGAIVFSNLLMVWLPMVQFLGTLIPPAIFAFGFVFVIRDFAQRAVGHWVLAFMALAAMLTYFFAGPAIGFASVSAFVLSELADWGVYTITKRPMHQRILLSSLVGVPVDTAAFFFALGILDIHSLAVGIGVKMIATVAVWLVLTMRAEEEGA